MVPSIIIVPNRRSSSPSLMDNTSSSLSQMKKMSSSSSYEQYGWNDVIPMEILGNISTYLDIEDVRNLIYTTNIKEQRDTIKKAFLKYNFCYVLMACANKSRSSSPKHMITCMESWLDVNKDWKLMYDDPTNHGITTHNEHIAFDYAFNNIITAVYCNIPTVIQHIIENRGADVNKAITNETASQNNSGMLNCPLLVTLLDKSYPSHNMLRYLLSVPTINVNIVVSPVLGFTCLHFASVDERCTPEKLRLFILKSKELNVNVQADDGFTPLHLVCSPRHFNKYSLLKAKILLDAGADVHVHTRTTHKTPLDCALMNLQEQQQNDDDSNENGNNNNNTEEHRTLIMRKQMIDLINKYV